MAYKPINVSQPSLPKGGGAVRGIGETFQPNAFTGTSSLSIPIPTSACRGFEPHLSLDYSSGSGNGIFGFGFNLSTPNISRKTAKTLPKYNDTDTFVISNADDLVLVQSGLRATPGYSISRYQPRTEGLFARIERWVRDGDGDTHWRVTGKDNVTSLYGESPDARIADPAGNTKTRIFQWFIERTYDARGNLVVYEYQADPSSLANITLSKIKYGNFSPGLQDGWHFEVVFDYGERPFAAAPQIVQEQLAYDVQGPCLPRKDPFSSYRAGFEIRTERLCRGILMFHRFGAAPFLVHGTYLSYDETPYGSLLTQVTQVGYRHDDAGCCQNVALPPLEFHWSTFSLNQGTFKPLEHSPARRIPGLPERGNIQMLDLYGEGLPGILYTDAATLLYSRPLGAGSYASPTAPHTFPIEQNLPGGQNTLMDLGGNGKLDLVVTTPSRAGFYESGRDGSWQPYRSFASTPTDLTHPQRQMVDVTGDGLADLLLFEENAVKVYPSMGKLGYGQPLSHTNGSLLPITGSPSAREAVRFADPFGDGGSHLLRIRSGSVACWPNLGYGRFGPKVEMENAPSFGCEMDPARLFLTDIDGSGTTDLVYAYPDHIDIYRNESGNRFSAPLSIPLPRTWNNLSQISFADVLGIGTACLVFTSLNNDLSLDHQYYDFTAGVKPHLLNRVDNNMGATTIIHYASSTSFYLADKQAGAPWITQLPFPVHVVKKIETIDHISGSKLIASYTYHHGYFDPIDREFRGFGRVDRMDAEYFEHPSSAAAPGHSLDLPPVLTKTWYHTGACAEAALIARQFAAEYYQADAQALHLSSSLLDDAFHLNSENASEACRALRGQVVREEVYALDQKLNPALKNPNLDGHPYLVTHSNFYVRIIQPKANRQYAVYFVHPRETITWHYERNPADPRISHTLILELDDFGNVLKSVAIGYGRRKSIQVVNEQGEIVQAANPELQKLDPRDQEAQTSTLITCAESLFTNPILTVDNYHAPLPAETRTYELTGYAPADSAGYFQSADFVQATDNRLIFVFDKPELNYEDQPTGGRQRRLIEHVRTVYRKDDMTDLLPPGKLETLALPGQSYQLAFTPGLLRQVFQRPLDAASPQGAPTLASLLGGQGPDHGGYLDLDDDGRWWIPTDRIFLSPNSADTPQAELACARQHFFLPHRARDPFHTAAVSTETYLTYDSYDLLVEQTRDPLGSVVKVENDYHVLRSILITDPNGNRTAVSFDALGMLIASAEMGKLGENLGDQLEDFAANPSLADLQAFIADPRARAASWLGKATTRIVYDLHRFMRTGQPPFAAVLARETHVSDLRGAQTKIQVSFTYSDAFGRVIQTKIQAEPGNAPARHPDIALMRGTSQQPTGDIRPGDFVRDAQGQIAQAEVEQRWVGTGRTVYNNKGKPVKQYEPFFSATHLYEPEHEVTDTGVTPILFYDPLERLVATLHPNHTFEKVVFDPWWQTSWDVNDTVLVTDPANDPDVGLYFKLLPAADYLPTWIDQRRDAQMGAEEKAAALKAAAHAATPARTFFDTLGRPALTIADNGADQKYATRVLLDIENNQRELINAHGRVAMRYQYDMLGHRLHQASIDAGERWMLHDVAGNPLYQWDGKNRQFRSEYDQLRRLTGSFLREDAQAEILIGRSVYGESTPAPENDNLRGQLFQSFDQAGVVTHTAYDFKGNLLSSQRQFAQVYWKTLDWSGSTPPALEAPVYTSQTRYDALNRPTELTAPDKSLIRPTYNAASLLERVEANLRGASQPTVFVADLDHNARGQRTFIRYGNGVTTTYTYDDRTYYLRRLETKRTARTAPGCLAAFLGRAAGKDSHASTLQDLSYTYDPVGNLAHIRDDAQQTSYFRNKRVEPNASYTYDALYRLIEATGREHLGQIGGSPIPHSHNDAPRVAIDWSANDSAALGAYVESYLYDDLGSLLKMKHRSTDPANPGWTRAYTYSAANNRLASTSVGKLTEPYSYDEHGNMTGMPHLSLVGWDCSDQLRVTARQSVSAGTPGRTWYIYDSAGQRVRQVTEGPAGAQQTPLRRKERLYLDGFELYREYEHDGRTLALETETLDIMDDRQRIALHETHTIKDSSSIRPLSLTRFQFGNHLGSASLELDAQARIISYEEYTPFGSTSYQAVRSQTESPKRYRYYGKERDDATGFYYYGARYYAPWLGCWTSPDPAGTVDGLNLFAFVRGNPIRFVDPIGLCSTDKEKARPQGRTAKAKANLLQGVAYGKEKFETGKQKYSEYRQAGFDKASDELGFNPNGPAPVGWRENLKQKPGEMAFKAANQEMGRQAVEKEHAVGPGLKYTAASAAVNKMHILPIVKHVAEAGIHLAAAKKSGDQATALREKHDPMARRPAGNNDSYKKQAAQVMNEVSRNDELIAAGASLPGGSVVKTLGKLAYAGVKALTGASDTKDLRDGLLGGLGHNLRTGNLHQPNISSSSHSSSSSSSSGKHPASGIPYKNYTSHR